MLRLRLLHVRAYEDPAFREPDPTPAMAKLAKEFPGALREIDELPLDVLRTRIVELEAAARDDAFVAPWMHASWSFHRLARGALAAKRWLSAQGPETDLD